MITEIISIGDELLVGQVVNTNATWMAQQLNEAGIAVSRIVAVADTGAEITAALDEAIDRADIVLVTGGLGPTRDDITKITLCHYFNTRLVFDEGTFRVIEKFFAARGYEVTERNRQQAEVPEACRVIPNKHGTAPGMLFEQAGKIIISMPGVPFEMQSMMQDEIMPMLIKKGNSRIVAHRTVLTYGVGESFLADTIKEWEENLPEKLKLAYLPSPGMVRLRLTGKGSDKQSVTEMINREAAKLHQMIPEIIFGYEDDTMEGVVGRLLRERRQTLSTAESCSGGYLSHLVTSVPGASVYFPGSVIAYSNHVKQGLLGVKSETIEKYGAVSEVAVIEMAEGARRRFGTTYALSISGIAGPDGGTQEKPVGTVWIALAHPHGTVANKFMFGEHRGRNIRRSALAALNMLRIHLLS